MEGQALKLLERLIKKRLETKERIQKPNEDHVTTRWIYEWVYWHFRVERDGDS